MLSFKLALRFLRPASGMVLSGFMSLASTVGIAIGVLALITGLSAMNGFEYELENRVLSVIPQVQIKAQKGYFNDAEGEAAALEQASKQITACVPALELQAVVHNQQSFQAVMLLGLSEEEARVINIESFMTLSLADINKPHKDGSLPLVLGKSLADSLKLKIGDKVQLMNLNQSSQAGADLAKTLRGLTSREFILAGTLSIGGQLDGSLAITSYQSALAISGLKGANSLHVKTADFLNCLPIVYRASAVLSERASLTSWMAQQGKLYRDIQMIRSVMYLAMIMVMGVACFNIIGTLFMLVNERRHEIAIMLTLGFKRIDIIKVFTLVGLFKGGIGTLIGTVLGVLLSFNLTAAVSFIEKLFNTKFLNENIYFISFIPSRLNLIDVMLVIATALVMSSLAALFPALKASHTDPAKVLNE